MDRVRVRHRQHRVDGQTLLALGAHLVVLVDALLHRLGVERLEGRGAPRVHLGRCSGDRVRVRVRERVRVRVRVR